MTDAALPSLADFEAALPALRPELHRYCARMTGSVIDGEDVLQEALLNAARALRDGVDVENLRPWLFRIAHNAALNYVRGRQTQARMKDEMMATSDVFNQMPSHPETADTLRPFLALTPQQRSMVILRDVLGYTAAEVAGMTDLSVSSVKSALHRGRTVLKRQAEVGARPETEAANRLDHADRQRLSRYADFFNAHEFHRLRDLPAAEVRLELVSRENRKGREAVGGYFTNYSKRDDWLMAPGAVEGRPAILAFSRDDPSAPPGYFILLKFDGEDVRFIRDFRYARYAMADARWVRW